jgi:hypothetical protein
MAGFQTKSEAVFADYLTERSYDFEYELSSGSHRLDFWVDAHGSKVVCEVKEINVPVPDSKIGSIDPYKVAKAAIKAKAKQGKELKGKYPYIIVIRKHRFWPVDEISVPGAMFGDLALSMPLNTQTGQAQVEHMKTIFSKGATLQPEQNRAVSAVAILDRFNPTARAAEEELNRRLEGQQITEMEAIEVIIATYEELTEAGIFLPDQRVPYLKVFHNPHATLPLPMYVFAGEHDVQWGQIDGRYTVLSEGIERRPTNAAVDESSRAEVET